MSAGEVGAEWSNKGLRPVESFSEHCLLSHLFSVNFIHKMWMFGHSNYTFPYKLVFVLLQVYECKYLELEVFVITGIFSCIGTNGYKCFIPSRYKITICSSFDNRKCMIKNLFVETLKFNNNLYIEKNIILVMFFLVKVRVKDILSSSFLVHFLSYLRSSS